MTRWGIAVVAAWAALAPATATAQEKQATATGTGGAAASVDVNATNAAIEALDRGGNAVDAAVAAAAVLGVTEPFSAGIGGGGFMVIRTADGRVTTIDHRELSPQAMRPDSFMENGLPLAFNDARYSGLSAGVPGTIRGWDEALDEYGTWSLGRALQSGIRVARDGFVVDQTFADQTTPNVPWFDDVPSTAALYLDRDGTPRDVGSTLRNPDLAKTYDRIARRGADAFYTGDIAKAITQAIQRPPIATTADHRWRPGLVTTDDLAKYDAPERPPTQIRYRGLDVYGMGPPSSGGSTTGEALNILEGYERLNLDRTRPSTSSSRRAVSASPTATPTWPTPRSSTSRCGGCCPTGSQPSAAPSSTRPAPRRAPSRPATPTATTAEGRASRTGRAPRTRAAARRTWSSRTTRATSSPTRSRSSRPAATASSSRATASCSTTS